MEILNIIRVFFDVQCIKESSDPVRPSRSLVTTKIEEIEVTK